MSELSGAAIVGAGTTGLARGVELNKRGLRAVIFDEEWPVSRRADRR